MCSCGKLGELRKIVPKDLHESRISIIRAFRKYSMSYRRLGEYPRLYSRLGKLSELDLCFLAQEITVLAGRRYL